MHFCMAGLEGTTRSAPASPSLSLASESVALRSSLVEEEEEEEEEEEDVLFCFRFLFNDFLTLGGNSPGSK